MWKNIREFFWPLLEIPDDRTNPLRQNFEIPFEKTEDIDALYELVKHTRQEEEDRIKTIETKSIVFIGSVGLSLSVFSLLSKSIFEETLSNNQVIFILIVITLIALMLYIVRVGWFCIKALDRGAYYKIHPASYINDNILNKKKIIEDMLINIEKNKNVINSKVDMMIMSQAYYKRVLISIPIFTALLALSFLFKSPQVLPINNSYNTIINKTTDTSVIRKENRIQNKQDTGKSSDTSR